MATIENRINDKLLALSDKHGSLEYLSLKPFMQTYLSRIEEIFVNKEIQEQTAINEFKKNKLSLLSISEQLNCSRTTLYNHNAFLKDYIEYSINLLEENNPFIRYDKLKSSISTLEEKVDKMTLRDIDTELLRAENKKLNEALKNKLDEVKRLQIRNAELSQELHTLKNVLKPISTVTPFPK
ncbi:hypothetical protein [Clostridium sp.]|uniref:hypothetical protein n=1 Tax=Clostridium sp. TaxID=1506 RepID=UPI003F3ADEBB